MSPRDNVGIARSMYEARNARDFESAAALCADDLELHSVATGERYRGPDGYLQYVQSWTAALPDIQLELSRISGGEEAVAVEYVCRGTHTGTLISAHGHIPPTWMQVELHGCDVLEIQAGKVRRLASYFDSGTMLRQMGLLPNSPIHPVDRRAPLELYALDMDAPVQQRNKAVVHWFLEAVINQRNPDAAPEFCAPNLAWHGGLMGETRDLAGFQQVMAAFFTSFPDLRVEVHDTIAEADRVAVRLSIHATHLGDFQGIPPTGKSITEAGTSTYRVVNGKIVEEWWQHDLLSVMQQLDVMPAMVRLSSEGE